LVIDDSIAVVAGSVGRFGKLFLDELAPLAVGDAFADPWPGVGGRLELVLLSSFAGHVAAAYSVAFQRGCFDLVLLVVLCDAPQHIQAPFFSMVFVGSIRVAQTCRALAQRFTCAAQKPLASLAVWLVLAVLGPVVVVGHVGAGFACQTGASCSFGVSFLNVLPFGAGSLDDAPFDPMFLGWLVRVYWATTADTPLVVRLLRHERS
jgi:hypothetical protein